MISSALPPVHPHLVSHPVNGLQDYIAISRYARYSPEKARRETWAEAVQRVRDMHLGHYTDKSLKDAALEALSAGEITSDDLARIGSLDTLHSATTAAFAAVERRETLPSMRSLQFGGEAILSKHARVYNCAFTYVDRLEVFREAFYLLLCGCGVGFSVQKHHVEKLPALAAIRFDAPSKIHVIEDTIEGWGDAIHELMLAAVEGRLVEFDYSLIRPAGAPLRTSGGKAPGPEPLYRSLVHIKRILHAAEGRKLKTIEAYDILMWAAKAVLSGGVRRSATICLFSADDEDMINAKTGDWFEENPQRTASNNSAVIVRSRATREEFDRLFEAQKQFGEPGFYFVENEEYGANPCVEIGLHPSVTVDADAISRLRSYGYQGQLIEGQTLTGVQFCNLTTISSAAVDSPERFYQLCAHAALIGTLQAGYSDIRYLSPVSRLITEREALLGVSICGILDRPEILLDREVLARGAATVKAMNAIVARAIGIRPAARTTCVKPEGTASLLLGTSSGLHPHHSQRYFRRVQANVHDPVFRHFKKFNPHMVEPSIYDPNGRTEVITFPVEGPAFGVYREDVSALNHLEYIHLVQKAWVQAGRRHEKFSPGLHHNVSCTVTVAPHDWQAVADFIWENRHDFTGIALLQESGDKLYAQAPRESVTPEDVERWNALVHEPVDYTTLIESEDVTELKAVIACAGGACELV
ncbi:recombinase [Opitutaceae bacterium TAV4]|uniref:recombinase n=1 Tax=Geminisphaera colitermitum TaxID=1148786 RepID=UPI000158D538|nr:recombinase [Geminisphaera colitermitum]RRJ94796.1 recombinase [Opitutaceae bacterium TAV4]RRJ99030.1 recombinase [Opitutaceae bacterium TAV3]